MSKHALVRTNSEHAAEQLTKFMPSQSSPIWIDAGVQKGPSLASYLEIPFKYKRLILFCSLLGLLAGWLAIVAWPRTYGSEAKLKMSVGRESVGLDPTATTNSTLMLQKTQQEEIISALEVLGSRRIAEAVVDDLGAGTILSGVLPGEPSQAATAGDTDRMLGKVTRAAKSAVAGTKSALGVVLSQLGIRSEISERELAVMRILSSIHIDSPTDSTIVNIGAQAKTPAMAQAIVQALTKAFMKEHLDGTFTAGSLDFFRTQTNEVERQLNAMVSDRSQYMQENKVVSIEANRLLLQEQLAGINRDLVVAYGDLEEAVAQANDLTAKNDQADDEIVAVREEKEDATWSGMRQQIYELELQEQLAAATYTSSHPQLKLIRAQLDGAREILEARESGRIDLNTTPNPVKINLGSQLQLQQTTIAGLKSAIAEKEMRQAEMQHRIDELLEQERHLSKVDRDIRLMEINLETLHEKLEEARVLDQLHTEQISNIHVFQPATFVERAVSPNKKVLAVGFLFLGLTTGLGLSLLRHGTSTVLQSSDDVELQLGFPVVASIPKLARMRSPRPREKRLLRQKCQGILTDVLLSQRQPRKSRGSSLGIISVDAGSGASTLAMHLAVTSNADCHMKTVLVDADSRERSISKMFGLNGTPGLVELVSGDASHDECLQHLRNTSVDLIASAANSCNEILSCGAPEIVQALQAYLEDCDLLVVDLPAASQPDQAIALAQQLDTVIVVVEAEKTQIVDAERLLRRLSQSETQVVGVVLNKTRTYLPKIVRSFVAQSS